MGKQKSPSDALSLQWYYKQFEMGKQKSPGGLPLGLFCFPKIIQTINDLIFISQWVININAGNVEFVEKTSNISILWSDICQFTRMKENLSVISVKRHFDSYPL